MTCLRERLFRENYLEDQNQTIYGGMDMDISGWNPADADDTLPDTYSW